MWLQEPCEFLKVVVSQGNCKRAFDRADAAFGSRPEYNRAVFTVKNQPTPVGQQTQKAPFKAIHGDCLDNQLHRIAFDIGLKN